MPSGFVQVSADDQIPDVGIGVLGYGFMARAHTNALKKIPYIYWPPPARPTLVAICGRTESRVAEEARRYEYEGYYTDWSAMVEDARIQVFDNCAPPHLHAEPSIRALQAGKHVICEKPLAMSVDEAYRMLVAARRAGVKHLCGFNYRFVPAVRLARELIQRGLLGQIYHFRGRYLQESLHDPTQPLARWVDPESRKAGALAIIGCHLIDMARFLVGEPATVSALMPRFTPERLLPTGERFTAEWDEATLALVEFEGGAVGTLEASRISTGRKNQLGWEINGSRGSLAFDLERLNELQVYLANGSVKDVVGFQDVLVTEPDHPFARAWWPRGHIVGWEHAHINQLHHFLEAVALGRDIAPLGATFEDGYRAAVVSAALEEATRSGRKVQIRYDA